MTIVRTIIFFVLILFFAALTRAWTEQAEVMSSSGQVQVLLNGTEDYMSAQEGMLLEAGDAIKTASGAHAELSFNEANTNVVRLSENTAVNVTFSGDEKLELSEGEAFSSISKLESGSSFEIRTPTVVSGARGTDWVTKVTAEGTDVEAINDEPYVRHFDKSGAVSRKFTVIKPGQMTTVKKFQRPRDMRPIGEERRQQWQKVKQNVRENADVALIKRGQRPQFDRKEFMRLHQKPAAMPSPERFEGKAVLESGPAAGPGKEGTGFKPRDKQGFKPVTETPNERDRFRPLVSKEAGAGIQQETYQEGIKGLKPLSSGDAQRKSPEYGELKSFEDKRAIKETLKKAGKKEAMPEAPERKQKLEGQDLPEGKAAGPGPGKQEKIPRKNIPASRPPAAAPVRR